MQQEEAGQVQRLDDPQLLLEPRGRRVARTRVGARRSARAGARAQSSDSLRIASRPPLPDSGSRDRCDRSKRSRSASRAVSATASGCSGKRAAIAAGEASTWLKLPAPLGLGGVERRVQAHGHERVLQRRPRAGVGVHVAGRHAGDAEPPRQPGQPPVARPVVAQERALELDPQPIATRTPRAAAAAWARRARRAARIRSGRPDPRRARARLQRDARLRGRPRPLARVRVRAGEDPAEIRPAARVLDQQRQMAPVLEVDLGAVDRAQTRARGRRPRTPSSPRPCCGRSARAPRSRAPARPGRAHRAARRRRGTRRRSGSGARRTRHEHMFASAPDDR